MGICFVPGFAYDVLCYGEQRLLNYEEYMFPEQKTLITEANNLLGETGYSNDKYLSMSTISLVLSVFTDNENIVSFGLNDLISIFSDPHHLSDIVRRKIGTDNFCSGYVLPALDWLEDGYARLYVDLFKHLVMIDFSGLWKTKAFPMVQRQCNTMQAMMNQVDVTGILRDIALMKQIDPFDRVSVYQSFLSNPVSFCLHNNSFLDSMGTCEAKHYIPIIAHELMHGFADSKLTEKYRTLVKADDFLKATHNTLIDKYKSGDEEEFTAAAEYFLCFKNNLFTYDELLEKALETYPGCMPLSILLFELLCKEESVPEDYNKWLHHIFDEGLIVAGSIKHSIDRLIPSYSDFFYGHHKVG